MNDSNFKPLIFFVFANDRTVGGAYLRNLPLELDGIGKALQKARQAGLCEVVEKSNTTVERILDVFLEYQDRIAVFKPPLKTRDLYIRHIHPLSLLAAVKL